ncbi:hypothetical protein PHLCEN_2v2134 [Hermanssonia centrifuga]|uniref:F-box domain-containing protein n=1 Tax=Hermanssonia centrifuga TaxID=98765 RepID=A0A2R6RPY8_9APHY|nr:hypothetical protein PHLCEN_2v2134 [Hermanssonia centrifuga]
MHRCLLVTEIFQLIAQFADLAPSDHPSPSAVLAQTCRHFHEPALDIRWRALISLCPLLACFPDDVCVKDTKETYTFTSQPILPAHWTRFQHYSHRVRSIHCSDHNSGLTSVGFRTLDLYRPGDPKIPLLPNLQELYWDDFRPGVAPYIRLFIQPALVTFHIISVSNPSLIAGFLDALARHAPALERLRIRSPRARPSPVQHGEAASQRAIMVTHTLSRALCSLRSLSELVIRVPPLGADHLLSLAHLPNLEILSCSLLDPGGDSMDASSLASSDADLQWWQFPALRRLDVTARDISAVSALIRAISSSHLIKISVHLETQPKATCVQDLFHALSTHHRNMREISILLSLRNSSDLMLNATSEGHLLTSTTLRPLLRLHALSHLYFVQLPFDLDDDFVQHASLAWPSLKKLSLGTMVRGRTTGVTMDGLRALAARCVCLQELALAIDIVPQNGLLGRRQCEASNLKTLDIGCTSIPADDVGRFINFVAQVFPHCNVCDSHDPFDNVRNKQIERLKLGIVQTHENGYSNSC